MPASAACDRLYLFYNTTPLFFVHLASSNDVDFVAHKLCFNSLLLTIIDFCSPEIRGHVVHIYMRDFHTFVSDLEVCVSNLSYKLLC